MSILLPIPFPPGYNIAKAPLYYVRSGYVGLNVGRSRVLGVVGDYWSSWSYSAATAAYHLGFSATGVGPSSHDYYRWFAFPLRCLAD